MKYSLIKGLVVASPMFFLFGCGTVSTPNAFTEISTDAHGPRPFTLDESLAKSMVKKFPNIHPIAKESIIDTAIWEDEAGTVNGGFDPILVYEATCDSHIMMFNNKTKTLLKNHGTIPDGLKAKATEDKRTYELLVDTIGEKKIAGIKSGKGKIDSSSNLGKAALDSWLFSKSTSGFSVDGVGLAFGAASFLTLSDEQKARLEKNNRDKQLVGWLSNGKVGYQISKEEKKKFFDDLTEAKIETIPQRVEYEKRKASFAGYLDKKFMEAMKEQIEAMGFKVKGDLVCKTIPDPRGNCKTLEHHQWIYYLENDVYGCGKGSDCALKSLGLPTAESDPAGVINNIDAGFAIDNDASFASKALQFNNTYAVSFELKNASLEERIKLYNELLIRTAKAGSGFVFYFPQWTYKGEVKPQTYIDKDGEHFFVVEVKRE